MEICATMTLQSCQLIGVAEDKLSKLFKIIYLARFHPSEHTGTNFREVRSDEKNREVSAWSYNSSMVSAGIWRIRRSRYTSIPPFRTRCSVRTRRVTWPIQTHAQCALLSHGRFRRKRGWTCGWKWVFTQKVAKRCSQIWYQCKAWTVRKAIIIFSAQQSTAMLTIFADEKKMLFSAHYFLFHPKFLPRGIRVCL